MKCILFPVSASASTQRPGQVAKAATWPGVSMKCVSTGRGNLCVPAFDHAARPATNAVARRIVIPAAVAEPRSTPGAAVVVGSHGVPRAIIPGIATRAA